MNKNLIEKIQRDPLYSKLEKKFGIDYVIDAGFFVDNNKTINVNDLTPCTPINEVKENAHLNNPCVILSSGSYNPFHDGHYQIILSAQKKLEELGYNVIGKYVAPANDFYIKQKKKDKALNYNERAEFIRNNYPDLLVDNWAGLFHVDDVNFTAIYKRLENYLRKMVPSLPKNFKVFYVCGGDNAGFAKSFALEGNCVVVKRNGYDERYESVKEELKRNKRIIFCDECVSTLSSTEILAVNDIGAYKSNKPFSCTVRMSKNNKGGTTNHEEEILKEIEKHFIDTKRVSVEEDRKLFKKIKEKSEYKIVSLDSQIKGDYQLRFSRKYDLFGTNKIGFCERPGTLASNMLTANSIKEDKIILFDDDRFIGDENYTGSTTMGNAKEFLFEKEIVNEIVLRTTSKYEEVLDIRDFMLGEPEGGLVVEGIRMPYIYPFVDPYTRASIKNPLEFSIAILNINKRWIPETYTINDLGSFGSFVLVINDQLKGEDSVVKMCEWYIEFLEGLRIKSSLDPEDWGVHISHCCRRHGCKYGNPECPVELLDVKQTYTCETGYDFNEDCFTSEKQETIDCFLKAKEIFEKYGQKEFYKKLNEENIIIKIENY